MDAIKLEGGRRVVDKIRAITDAGILVIGHIGLTPQSSGQLGGFKAQGRTAASAEELIRDALAIQEAGAFALLLEAVPGAGCAIAKLLQIPVYGIGAGGFTDGQLLINGDMLGYFDAFTPKFVKKYAEPLAGHHRGAGQVRARGAHGRLSRPRAQLFGARKGAGRVQQGRGELHERAEEARIRVAPGRARRGA